MTDSELQKIHDLLVKITDFISSKIDKKVNGCLHEENVQNLTTMGMKNQKYICLVCGVTWEEEFNNEGI